MSGKGFGVLLYGWGMLGVGLGLHGLGLWVVRVGVMVVAGFFGKFINLFKIIGFF